MAFNFPPNPTVGQTYSYNGHVWKWTGTQWIATTTPSSIVAPVYVSASAPRDPKEGSLWYNTVQSELFLWRNSPGGGYWQNITSAEPSPGAEVFVGVSEPVDPQLGWLWFNTNTNVLSVWSGSAWSEVSSEIPAETRSKAIVSASAPSPVESGLLWYDTINDIFKVWNSGPPGTWEEVGTQTPPEQFQTYVGVSPPVNPEQGELWFDSENSNLNIWYEDIDGGQWVSVVPYPFPDRYMPTTGGEFTGPIYAGYEIPDDPEAIPSVAWVEDYVSSQSFLHMQNSPSAVWTINHNLGYNPQTQLFTTGGQEFDADIVNTSTNQTVVYLTSPIAGYARLN